MNPATSPQDTPQSPSRILVGRMFSIAREAHGIGVRELAAMVEASPSHISRVLSGERLPSPELYDRLCQTFAALPGKRAS